MNDYSSTDREDLATEPQTLDEQTPGQVELVTETKTLHIDGEPLWSWLETCRRNHSLI